ncbi:MAG: Pseudouridine synthase [Berkelbacteria bacterium GW2011_GWB1_38_5]|uniref:Pseudouridine synthase n=2 Tax=Candidatus Berkelbacteria TaxID=1618330 RepID=A0A0G0FDE3_9BACT|nr:MAG: Pseudouridine synthase [Berkelbacteria bacterium GW2011_GWA1_36_9]KKQ72433.1 MAG: Pseudouridine synthase [Berkelbacteria bacterium GW2011_GWB1_38_5]
MDQIKIIYNDEYLLVVDKPAGILVHETLAKEKDTLVNWLVTKYPDLKNLSWPDVTRPGIVHRLDKDTSGLIILAKNPKILSELQKQFKERTIQKTYKALVLGKVEPVDGKIETLIVRGKAGIQQVREFNFSVSNETLRPATTLYKTLDQYQFNKTDFSLLSVMPKTGRMHQIRVHLKYINYPIVGDPLYNTKLSRNISKNIGLDHQFLHAEKLEFQHPIENKILKFESDLPNELANTLAKLEKV